MVEGLVLIAVICLLGYLTLPLASTRPPAPKAKISADSAADAMNAALRSAPPARVAAIEASFADVPGAPVLPGPAAVIARLPAGAAYPPEVTNMAPFTVVENVRTVIHNYGQRFGGNPIGSNAEITRTLGGDNPGRINFLNPEAGLRVNVAGELIDAWGTPFFFHQLSGTEMEIHSAGPDKILWTIDDLVTR